MRDNASGGSNVARGAGTPPWGSVRVKAPDTARPPATADEAWRQAGGGRPPLWRKEHGNGSAPRFASIGRALNPEGTACDACRVREKRSGAAGGHGHVPRAGGPVGAEGKRSRVGAFDVTGEPGVSDGDAQRG